MSIPNFARGAGWLRLISGRRFSVLTAAATFVLAAVITLNAWYGASQAVETAAAQEFDKRVEEMRNAIRGRMVDYAQVLRGGAGVFAASGKVGRTEWRAYVEALRTELSYPGIEGLGVIPRVPEAALDEHEKQVRAEGPDEYAVKPRGSRPEFFPVAYIEPRNDRNLRALGYDMYSEATRRAAMQRARDTGEPAISGRVVLVQELDSDALPGFLMFLPIYRTGAPADLIEDRRANLAGFVYAPFRVRDLMRGLLGAVPDIRLEIFDGLVPNKGELLYDSSPALAGTLVQTAHASTSQIIVQDRVWTVRATGLPEFDRVIDRTRPNATLAAGFAICLMLTALVWVLATLRERALDLAEKMTSQLRDSRERLSLALEGSNLALFDWDLVSGTVTLSPLWNSLLGGRPAVTITSIESLQALVHPDDLAALKAALLAAVKGETDFYDLEHRVRTLTGAWTWISSHAKVSERDQNGRACRITGTNADISERKAVEDLKNEFIGTVSHELRTPLTAVIGALEILKEEFGDHAGPEATMFLDMAYQNSERLAALVNHILDLEKSDAGKLELKLERVDLEAFLERALSLNSQYAEQHGTRFVLEPMDAGIYIKADAQRLLQVLTNLMSNAAKYSPRGEPVILRTSVTGTRARVDVADQGPGVPPEFSPRLFSRFAQAGGAKGGTGLGLAISKALIEAMGGTIGYTPGVPRGSVFYFETPLADS